MATPGRLIGALTMRRCTFLVFDEAEHMFELGFAPQVQVSPLLESYDFWATKQCEPPNSFQDCYGHAWALVRPAQDEGWAVEVVANSIQQSKWRPDSFR